MNTLLVSIALTEADLPVVEAAAALTYKVPVRQVMLYHTTVADQPLPDPSNFGLGTLNNAATIAEHEDTLTAQKVRMQRKVNHSAIVSYCMNGQTLPEAIPNLVDKEHVDLIVIGQPAEHSWFNFAQSDSLSIIRASRAPVLMVPQKGLSNVKGIALACDLTDTTMVLPVDLISSWVKVFNAKLHLVYNNEDPAAHDAGIVSEQFRLEDTLKDLHPVFYSPADEDTIRGILEYIERHDIQLLICTAREQGFWEHLFNGSKIQQLLQRARLPVMLVKAQ